MPCITEISAREASMRKENPDLAEAAKLLHQVHTFGRWSVYLAHEAGTLLIRAKKQLKHGCWGPALKKFGINQATAGRYMVIARSFDILQLAEFQSVDAALQEAKGSMHHGLTGFSEWFTPSRYISAARISMNGITLDPASCKSANEVVKADRFYSVTDNGLKQNWSGEKVWLNPPYDSERCSEFMKKFVYSDIECGCCLVNTLVSSSEAGQLLLENSDAVCFVSGRIAFEGPRSKGQGSQYSSMIAYRGSDPDQFHAAFEGLGVVIKPMARAKEAPMLKLVNK